MTSPEWPPVSDAEVAIRELHEVGERATSEHHECDPAECDRAGEGEMQPWCLECRRWAPCDTLQTLDDVTAARSALPEAGTVEAAAVVESFVKRMDEVYDSFPDDTHEQFLEGWLRAVGEIEVNLRYHVDPSLHTTPPTPPSEAGDVEAAVAWDAAAQDAWGHGWLHDIGRDDPIARNPYRIARTPTATEGG